MTNMSEQDIISGTTPIYFSHQCCLSLYCGLHALNNIYGREEYTITQLNNICYSMSDEWINPHKHIFGGEYDANVLIKALEEKENDVRWHDNRKKLSIGGLMNQNRNRRLRGFLVNNRMGNWFVSCLFRTSARHWVAVRKIGEEYVILDSSRNDMIWMKEEEIESYLNSRVQTGSEVLAVIQ